MSPKRESDDPVQQEVVRLVEMLRIFVRTLGYGNAEIARRAHLPHANVGRYFRGEARVPLDFVIAVVRALGLEFGEFFELAYAEQPGEPSEARRKIERILQILPARRPAPAEVLETPPPEQAQPLPRPEIEKMLADLRREVQALLDASETGKVATPTEPPTEPGPARPPAKKQKRNGER